MPFDSSPDPARSRRGLVNRTAGRAAEDIVARLYADRGIPITDRNWCGTGGELDLIGWRGEEAIVVEVKSSKTHDLAASHVTPAQIARIFRTVDEFLGEQPKGLMTDVRIDLALVDGLGRVEVIENAFAG